MVSKVANGTARVNMIKDFKVLLASKGVMLWQYLQCCTMWPLSIPANVSEKRNYGCDNATVTRALA